ncbi:hypothetical protein [Cyclobacterium marinum]|nr:hypothetical protein [Cyclobacterium marinum]
MEQRRCNPWLMQREVSAFQRNTETPKHRSCGDVKTVTVSWLPLIV